MSSSPLVMITGGNGFVGYAVIAGVLKAGVCISSFINTLNGSIKISDVSAWLQSTFKHSNKITDKRLTTPVSSRCISPSPRRRRQNMYRPVYSRISLQGITHLHHHTRQHQTRRLLRGSQGMLVHHPHRLSNRSSARRPSLASRSRQ